MWTPGSGHTMSFCSYYSSHIVGCLHITALQQLRSPKLLADVCTCLCFYILCCLPFGLPDGTETVFLPFPLLFCAGTEAKVSYFLRKHFTA